MPPRKRANQMRQLRSAGLNAQANRQVRLNPQAQQARQRGGLAWKGKLTAPPTLDGLVQPQLPYGLQTQAPAGVSNVNGQERLPTGWARIGGDNGAPSYYMQGWNDPGTNNAAIAAFTNPYLNDEARAQITGQPPQAQPIQQPQAPQVQAGGSGGLVPDMSVPAPVQPSGQPVVQQPAPAQQPYQQPVPVQPAQAPVQTPPQAPVAPPQQAPVAPPAYNPQGGNNQATLQAEYDRRLAEGHAGNKFLAQHPRFATNLQTAPTGQQGGPLATAPVQQAVQHEQAQQTVAQAKESPNLALPLSPEFEAGRRAIDDQLAADLAGIGAARQEIPAMLDLIKARLATDEAMALRGVREAMSERGMLDSSVTTRNLGEQSLGFDRTRQDLAMDTARQLRELMQAESGARSGYGRSMAELLMEVARNQAGDDRTAVRQDRVVRKRADARKPVRSRNRGGKRSKKRGGKRRG